MHYTIRKAIFSDLDRIRQIAHEAYQPYVSLIGQKPAPMIADFSWHLENDVIFVVEETGGPLGYAIIVVKSGVYWLENIAVLPAHAQKGIGTVLIEHVEQYISKYAPNYHLYTNIKMTENIKWYRRSGFEETKRCVEDGFERVFFVKNLSDRYRR